MSYVVAVDVGGTFTDLCAVDSETGGSVVHKRPSTPQNPAQGILAGIEELCEQYSIEPSEIMQVSHGTTVATNALIEHRGGKVALLVTKGFRDLLEIGRQTRPLIYDFQTDRPPALVPRERRFEVDERVTRGGEVLRPLADGEIARVVEEVRAAEVDSVAVCLLFSFLAPEHERQLGLALRAAMPNLLVSLSHEVQPEFREYERLSTTVLNAYLQPVMDSYLATLEGGLGRLAPPARLGINQSSGGLISVRRAARLPVRTALSGPAAGIAGAVATGRASGFTDIITLDMGGTSADVCLIRDGRATVTHERWVEGYPVRLPSVDVNAVGAGGGSVAWRDRDGLLKVGPLSAGAVPGPACYRRGGTRPTVSDANAVLGRLPPDLLNGKMTLDIDAARRVIGELAGEIGLGVEETALGILDVVVANMTRAVRTISVERGFDPRQFILMPFGGAGPLHGSAVARSLEITRMIVPRSPGLLCAQGLLCADDREEFVSSITMLLDGCVAAPVEAARTELTALADRWFEEEAVPETAREIETYADLRYVGQNFELSCPWRGELFDPAAMIEEFHDLHERSYGFSSRIARVELVCVRLVARGRKQAVDMSRPGTDMRAAVPVGTRRVTFGRGVSLEAATHQREMLSAGDIIEGPAIIDQMDTTTVLYPGDRAVVDGAGNLVIEVGA